MSIGIFIALGLAGLVFLPGAWKMLSLLAIPGYLVVGLSSNYTPDIVNNVPTCVAAPISL